jgi:hypothetical protein
MTSPPLQRTLLSQLWVTGGAKETNRLRLSANLLFVSENEAGKEVQLRELTARLGVGPLQAPVG